MNPPSTRATLTTLLALAGSTLIGSCATAPSPAGLYHLDRERTKQSILETERDMRSAVDDSSVEMRLHEDGRVIVWSRRPDAGQRVSEGSWQLNGETVTLIVNDPDNDQRTVNAEYGGERLLITEELLGKPLTLVLVREPSADDR